ncbi:hypothetical protein [Neoroseomonas lacus]|uniref:Uncharacterized protein n=1 Tax=Neoroseomonas lacus TaxID=287609 RepID=A0A917NKX1_9PROT|nr:hypothetical protein [Neoroseomonas lacus]GGJ08133.1 hypothetical protein GCM10011320_13910 [Neoroseomonas lacus]
MSRIFALTALLPLLASPALAQTRSLVVPPGSAVVIAPRGEPAPRTHLAPPPRPQQQRMVMVAPSGETLSGPTAWAAAGMAAAAVAAVLFAGGAGGGGSGGGSATASASATVRR